MAATLTLTGNTTSGSAVVASVAANPYLAVGQAVTGAGIPAGATIAALSPFTLSANATATATGVTLSIALEGYTQVIAARTQGLFGSLLNGTLEALLTDGNDVPANGNLGGPGGALLSVADSVPVVNGQVPPNTFVPDTTQTGIANLCVRFTFRTASGRTVKTLSKVQPSGTTLNLDTYVAPVANLAIVQQPNTVSFATPQGPTVITAGGTYTGIFRNTDPTQYLVEIDTAAPVTFLNCVFMGVGLNQTLVHSVLGTACSVIFTNCIFHSQNPTIPSVSRSSAIYLQNPLNVTVQNCTFKGTANGIGLSGSGTQTQSLLITQNHFINHEDRAIIGTRTNLGHPILLSGVDCSLHGGTIGWNLIENAPGRASCEDAINLYETFGSAAHPLVVANNMVDGAFTTVGASYSGGGITTDGTSGSTAYVAITANTLIRCLNGGIALAYGSNLTASGNTIVCSGREDDDATWISPWSNGQPSGGYGLALYATVGVNAVATGNTVGYVNLSNGSPQTATRYDVLNAATSSGSSVSGTVSYSTGGSDPTAITRAMELAAKAAWWAAANAAGIAYVGAKNVAQAAFNGQAAKQVAGTLQTLNGYAEMFNNLDATDVGALSLIDWLRWFLAPLFLTDLTMGNAATQSRIAFVADDGSVQWIQLNGTNFEFYTDYDGSKYYNQLHVGGLFIPHGSDYNGSASWLSIDGTNPPAFSRGAVVQNSPLTTQRLNISQSNPPSGSSAAGTQGDIAWDANYFYVCIAANTWKRSALTTW